MVPLGPYGGDVRSLIAHPSQPDIFFLGTADGQIYRSTNRGDQWERLLPGLNRRGLVVDNFAFDPEDPDHLYAATWELRSDKGWLYRTRDGGRTWVNIPLGRYQSSIRALAIAPSDPQVISLGISEGVILSLDRGETWDRISRGYRSLYNVESLAFDPRDSTTLYVGTWHLGWKTVNLGKKWQPIHKGMLSDSDLFCLLVNPRQSQTLYAGACTGVYKSENGGLHWSRLKKGLPREAKRTRTLHLDPSQPQKMYAGTTVGLFRSENGGDGWQCAVPDVVVNAVAVHPKDNHIILVGTEDAGVLKSIDGGNSFFPANQGFIQRRISALAVHKHESRLYAAVSFDRHHGGFFLTDDEINWKRYNKGLGNEVLNHIRVILPSLRDQRVYLGTPAGLFVGVPQQDPWQLILATQQLAITDLAFSGVEENRLFLATQSGVYILDIKDFKIKELPISVYRGEVNSLLYDPLASQLFVGTDRGVFRSDDLGSNWSLKVNGLPHTEIQILAISGRRLLCGTPSGIFFSDDEAERWNTCTGIHPVNISTIKSNPLRQEQLFAADNLLGYLFRSNDSGAGWEVMNPGPNNPRIASLAFAPSGKLLAGTASDGICWILPDPDQDQKR